jgi:adenosine deaminase
MTPLPDAIDFERIPRAALPGLLSRMPKAELHVHVEGTLEPELIFRLARQHGRALAHPDVAALRAAYDFADLQAFLDLYYAGTAVLLEEEDFFELGWAYLRRAAADRVVRAEIFFDPQAHTARGVPLPAVLGGLHRACERARAELGVDAALILCFLRHLDEEDALATLEAALPFLDRFIGVGLDSSERGHPPEKFARVFARARALGLRRVAHAGEEGPPAYVRGALDALAAERIDHGVRSLEDPALVARLVAAGTPLTVCPLSNVKLRVFDDLAGHNLPALLRAGLVATVNSDDPAYFGGYVNRNYLALFEALPALGPREAYQLARNSLEASFAPEASRRAWLADLDACFAAAVG